MSFFGGGLMQGMAGGLNQATGSMQQKKLRDMMVGPTATPNPIAPEMDMGQGMDQQPNLMQQLMRMFGG